MNLSITHFISSAVVALAMVGNAGAQENQLPPSPPLQWPTDPSASNTGFYSLSSLRFDVTNAANASLCKNFMAKANLTIPDPFDYDSDCPANIKSNIDSGKGPVHWKQGARPTECGNSCVQGPFKEQTLNMGAPNSRFALVTGKLMFEIEIPQLASARDLEFDFAVDARCDVPVGKKTGTLNIVATVDPPSIGGAQGFEALIGALIQPFHNLVDDITQRIRNSFPGQGTHSTTSTSSAGPCSSIGVNDSAFLWDVPRQATILPVVSATVKPTVTVFFDHITNNVTSTSPTSKPPTPRLTLYVNGVPRPVPLPANVTSVDSKLCVNFPMDGADRLQLLLNDGLGDAVWSQFTAANNFGTGSHNLTTTRSVLMPDSHGKLQKGTSPGVELDYRIAFHPTPQSEGAATAAPSAGGPASPHGAPTHGPIAITGVFTTGTTPSQTCINSNP